MNELRMGMINTQQSGTVTRARGSTPLEDGHVTTSSLDLDASEGTGPSSPTASRGTSSALEDHAALYFRCFAMVLFFDRAVRGTTHSWHVFATTVFALAVIVNPRSRAALFLLAVSQATWFLNGYARDAMVHWGIGFLGCVTVLLALLASSGRAWRTRCWPSNVDLFATMAPALRAIFFIGLTSAGFAKLNGGFLDPKLSCGALYYTFQSTFFPFTFLPTDPWALKGAIAFTIFAELIAPFFLLVRFTRPFAVVVVATFLFMIGTNPENQLYEFAGLFLTYLLAFAPPERFSRLHREIASLLDLALSVLGMRNYPRVMLLLGTVIGGFMLFAGDIKWLHLPRLWVCRGLFVVVVPIIAASLARSLWFGRASRLQVIPRPLVLTLVPLFFLVNEGLPYVGLPHMPTMTMAGNVNINRGYSDHLLVKEVPPFDFNRLVTIRESNNARVGAGVTMPWLVFAHHLAERPETDVRFSIDGVEEHIPRSGADPRFQSTSWLVPIFRLGPTYVTRRSIGCGNKRQLFLQNHPEKKDLLPPL